MAATVQLDQMLAAVYIGDGRLDVERRPVPAIGPNEALVEVSHCGICGTDLHLVLEKLARPGSVLGHEWSGTIAQLGDNVRGWRVGDRVVANPTPGCGHCRACHKGRPSVCLNRPVTDFMSGTGAYTRYKVVEKERLLSIPDSLGTREAALAEPTAIAIHTVNLSGVTPDDRVLVTGGGPVGLLTTAVLRTRGVTDITLSEPSEVRRERALAVGAAHVITPDELQPAQMGTPVEHPFTMIFECSGRASAAEMALDQLDYAGVFMFVGTGHDLPRINHNRSIIFEHTLLFAFNYDPDGFVSALELLASGDLPLEHLIEADDVTLDNLLGTMQRLGAGELPGKVLVRPEVAS